MELSSRARHLNRIQWIKTISFVGLLTLCFAALLWIDQLLISFVLGIVISFLMSPIVSHFERNGLSRTQSILLVYCTFFAVGIGLISAVTPFLVSQVQSLKSRLPEHVEGTVSLFNKFTDAIEVYSIDTIHFDFGDKIRAWLTSQSSVLLEGIPSILSSSAAVLFLAPFFGFFILKDGRNFSRDLLKVVPNNIFELSLNLQYQIGQQIGFYIRARLLESLIVGLVCLIGFWIIGTPYAVLLASFAALANLIPYVGPLFGAAPGIILALINQSSSLTVLLVLGVYLVAQVIDNLVIIPFVVARIVNLHPVTVILVVLLGAQIMGILGMLISIPVASTLKVTFQSIYNHLTDYSG